MTSASHIEYGTYARLKNQPVLLIAPDFTYLANTKLFGVFNVLE